VNRGVTDAQGAAPKTVLVTGAAGFLGSHLTERCLALGWHVIAIDSLHGNYDETLKRANLAHAYEHPACTIIEDDLLALDLESLVQDVSIVFHLAAQPGVRSSWDDFDLYARLNVKVTQRLLHASCAASLERFVLASSSSVYGDAEARPTPEEAMLRPVSPYGVTKVAAENLADVYWRAFGVPVVRLRYFTIYGPRQRPDMAFHRLITRALAGEPFEVFGDGCQTRDFTFVADAVSGTIEAAQCADPGRVYNIAGGSYRSMNSVLDSLGRLLEGHVERRYLDPQKGDARDTAASIDRARRELGYRPSFDFDAGLQAQLEWQRTYAARPAPVSADLR
jgi:nucleoside-diphosphate-sugar epimerase